MILLPWFHPATSPVNTYVPKLHNNHFFSNCLAYRFLSILPCFHLHKAKPRRPPSHPNILHWAILPKSILKIIPAQKICMITKKTQYLKKSSEPIFRVAVSLVCLFVQASHIYLAVQVPALHPPAAAPSGHHLLRGWPANFFCNFYNLQISLNTATSVVLLLNSNTDFRILIGNW